MKLIISLMQSVCPSPSSHHPIPFSSLGLIFKDCLLYLKNIRSWGGCPLLGTRNSEFSSFGSAPHKQGNFSCYCLSGLRFPHVNKTSAESDDLENTVDHDNQGKDAMDPDVGYDDRDFFIGCEKGIFSALSLTSLLLCILAPDSSQISA